MSEIIHMQFFCFFLDVQYTFIKEECKFIKKNCQRFNEFLSVFFLGVFDFLVTFWIFLVQKYLHYVGIGMCFVFVRSWKWVSGYECQFPDICLSVCTRKCWFLMYRHALSHHQLLMTLNTISPISARPLAMQHSTPSWQRCDPDWHDWQIWLTHVTDHDVGEWQDDIDNISDRLTGG